MANFDAPEKVKSRIRDHCLIRYRIPDDLDNCYIFRQRKPVAEVSGRLKSYWICTTCDKFRKSGLRGEACNMHLLHEGAIELILTDPTLNHHPQCIPKRVAEIESDQLRIRTNEIVRKGKKRPLQAYNDVLQDITRQFRGDVQIEIKNNFSSYQHVKRSLYRHAKNGQRKEQSGPSDTKRPRLESSASLDLSFNNSSSTGNHVDMGQHDVTVDIENNLPNRLSESDSLPHLLTTPYPTETCELLSPRGEMESMNILLTTLDSIIDAKVLPVFMNVDGVDQQCSTNFISPTQSTNIEATAEWPSSIEDGNGANLNLSKTDAYSSSFDLTCDFCQKICISKDVLKHHLLAKHVGGYCSSFCSACHFKDPNARRVLDHCRSVHKNMNYLKQYKPTDQQWRLLLDIKTRLQRRHIDFDLPKRD